MNLTSSHKYAKLTDREIINSIITKPYNEEAAVFLFYERYTPKFRKLCKDIYGTFEVYYDCVDDLFLYLKGNKLDWDKLRSFMWKSRFSTWIGRTAFRRFIEIKPLLIGKINNTLSIDDVCTENCILHNSGNEDYGRRMRKVLLMEAIGQLKDREQKFVILKTLEGYDSSEIAVLMARQWRRDGTVKYNNKGNIVIPSASYVDVHRQRAKEELKRILVTID